jgi:hypothetical protein
VDADSVRADRQQHPADLAGGLAAADRADTDQWQRGEVDAGTKVELDAQLVLVGVIALNDGDDVQVRCQLA